MFMKNSAKQRMKMKIRFFINTFNKILLKQILKFEYILYIKI